MPDIIQKMAKNYFTIVIPTLNEEKNLPKLLNDLKLQSFKRFVVVVVDAKSKDATQKIAKQYKANLTISSKKNVSYQRNLGAKEADSPWIVFMDADNRIPKTYLQKIKRHLEKEDPDILSTWMRPDSNSNKDKLTAGIMNIFMDINKNSKKPYVLESMVFIKKGCFEKLKGFDITIPWREGEDLLERAYKMEMNFDFIKTPKYTYSFRRLKKVGAFKMLQEMSQMEIIKMLKGDLTKEETKFLYPMKGGAFYKSGGKSKLTLKEFLAILFK